MTRRPGRRRPFARAAFAICLVILLGGLGVVGWAWWTGSIGGLPVRPHCTATALNASTELDPEQAGNAAVIAAVAVRRNLPARAATIGIATAMQESKLYNVSGGDLDSIGLFQQRPSQGWGTAAQVQDPVYATNAFFNRLVKIEGYQDLPITEAAQKVQLSAFPAAYADHEPQARIWASSFSGYSPAALSCVLDAPKGSGDVAPGADGLTPRARALATAAQAETGRGARAVAGSKGSALQFTVAGKEVDRLSWALAQWAVAKADDLDLTAVEVAGKQWRRDSGADGWTASDHPPPAGTVIIRTA